MDLQARGSSQTAPTTFYLLQAAEFIRAVSDAERSHGDKACFTLLIMTNGRGMIRMKEEQLAFIQGKCYLLHPGMEAQIEPDGYGCSYYLLEFRLQVGLAPAAATIIPDRTVLACTPFARVLELLEDLLAYSHPVEELQLFYRYVRFQELLLLILSQNHESAAIGNSPELLDRQGITLSIKHIHEHYRDALTVGELAAIASTDRWKYTRLFKDATGLVPLQYLNRIRIEQAKKWLAGSEDNLSAVAQYTGYTNEYYFNRRFKQFVGITPGQYRSSHRGQPRVIAPFLEDYMVALNITPVVQYSHAVWGKQDYLALDHIPTFDESNGDFTPLASYSPDCIMLLDRYCDTEYRQCQEISQTHILKEMGHNWRTLLRIVGDYFGRSERAEEVIAGYEAKARAAREKLGRSRKRETVAFLRISADNVYQYTDRGRGFATAVLYGDLGLSPYQMNEAAEEENQARMKTFTLEELSALTADHLFITFDKWHSQAAGAERTLLQHPVWSALPAVQGGHVYEVDFMTWMNYGVISNAKKIDDILQALA
ncbi:AraC family transcriptional regulator [Paenibacillus paridis]|uniref:AraC family transcriptional regulator n=1 Tax=Paenibacillus paridis TaxID=2583376 RepID=UPI00111F2084|nr:AraC family transcriptional regulator [Paenibacillus paridis]